MDPLVLAEEAKTLVARIKDTIGLTTRVAVEASRNRALAGQGAASGGPTSQGVADCSRAGAMLLDRHGRHRAGYGSQAQLLRAIFLHRLRGCWLRCAKKRSGCRDRLLVRLGLLRFAMPSVATLGHCRSPGCSCVP